jgi:transposase
MLLADRGYDADWIREFARQQGAWANIPPKRNRKDPICFSPYLYRARNLVERTHPTSAVLSYAGYFAKRVTLSLALRSSGDAGRGLGRVGAAAALVAG